MIKKNKIKIHSIYGVFSNTWGILINEIYSINTHKQIA